MKPIILDRLSALEQERDIKVLFACESGSRAWGFPSPDSDYDVRFIYVKPIDWYLSLHNGKDTIDLPINDELDIGGWELKKALNLLRKSNAPMLEWLDSPILYRYDAEFLDRLKALSAGFFSPIATVHHYLSMSKKYIEACQGPELKLKRYFYALRTAVAARWIREQGTMPPTDFTQMLPNLDSALGTKIKELIALKAGKGEAYVHPQEPEVLAFLEEELALSEAAFQSLRGTKGDLEGLDQLFRDTIKAQS